MTNQAGNGTVLWQVDARGVATVTLNRPEVNNAYNGDMLDGLHEIMDLLGQRADLRIVVLKGNGRHFQAGADLAWIRSIGTENPAANVAASRITASAVRRLDNLPIPTVALIQGGCFGGGAGVAAACDIVVAADDAIFAITETRWGLMPGVIVPPGATLCADRRALRRRTGTGDGFRARDLRTRRTRRGGRAHRRHAAAERARLDRRHEGADPAVCRCADERGVFR
jgi:methylglutaconyl-CoA hydratase